MTNTPRFVNLQSAPVVVSGPNPGEMIAVHPWHHRRRDQDNRLFVVEGDYYAQFVSDNGPLYPFPEQEDTAAGEGAAPVAVSTQEAEAQVEDVSSSPPAPEESEEEDAEEVSTVAEILRGLEAD